MGHYGPFSMLQLFGSMSPFTLQPHQCAFPHVKLLQTQTPLLLTVFHSFPTCPDPYQTQSHQPFQGHVKSVIILLSFHITQELFVSST